MREFSNRSFMESPGSPNRPLETNWLYHAFIYIEGSVNA